MPLTMRSTRSGSTARLRSATSTERISLSRSKGTRRPLRLTTVSSRSWTRSKVVNRPPQSGQTRRRRIAVLSSDGRESFTCVSAIAAIGTAHGRLPPASSLIDREAVGERPHLLLHRRLDQRRRAVRRLRHRVEHLGDQLADLLELGDAEAARRAGRRAEPDAGGDERLLRIVGHAVLVAGEAGADERLLRDVALEPLRPQVDQHQVVVGAAGDDVEAGGSSASRPAPGRSRRCSARRP